jgi:hypothetical protein
VDIAGVNHAGATLPWRSNEPTTGIVRFATGETFAGATEIESASLALAHQVSLIGLLPGVTYLQAGHCQGQTESFSGVQNGDLSVLEGVGRQRGA